jgi:hypothetical protein
MDERDERSVSDGKLGVAEVRKTHDPRLDAQIDRLPFTVTPCLPLVGSHEVITGHQRSSSWIRGVSELMPCFPL